MPNRQQLKESERSQVAIICEFLFYTVMIYACYISSGVYHEKILKHEYTNDQTQSKSTFQEAIIFTLFPPLACVIIGLVVLWVQKCKDGSESVAIPWRKAAVCSLVININMLTYNEAVIYASFPAVVMVKSCSLLSVIVVGIFCSRVKDKDLKLGKDKLVIGLIVTGGILLFNFFKTKETQNNDNPINLLSSVFLLISLIGDGILPDLQAQIKAQYKPTSIDLYYHINKFTFLISLLYVLITSRATYILTFILQCQEFRTDLLHFSLLNAFGQLIIYKMIKEFKQHIPAFIIATRKCFTVIVNIFYFGHSVVLMQMVGISLVFLAVMLEVYENYKQKKEKERQMGIKQDALEEQKLQPISPRSIDGINDTLDEKISPSER